MYRIAAVFICLLVLIMGGVAFSSEGKAPELEIAVHEFCPYLCDSTKENGKHGYVVDLLRAIYEPAFSLRFYRVPYVRGILQTETGRFDGMPMLNSSSSEKVILSREPIGILVQNFYVKKGVNWKYQGVQSLKGIVIGSILGYNYSPLSPEYETYQRNHRETEWVEYVGGVDATLINMRKILAGRITTFNECADLVDFIGMKEGIAHKFQSAGTLGIAKNYMGFSPKRADAKALADLFDKRIVQLRQSGELSRILAPYGVTDWVKKEPQ